ncbi:unnamed protein product [Ceutorhynchus assimilis]|uniref:DUF4817 domain-containing protein n=1 Tax=Ceutorhynchus assimilis TaxID=467358 RepID=A0A9N9MEV0_9CUCU|nr:unnamed protein product [Ceutorhynchus assimilis]
MEHYFYAKLADMHMIYGEAGGNGRRAERLYAERFPESHQPSHVIFVWIHGRLRESGSGQCLGGAGRPFAVRRAEFEEAVLHHVEDNPSISVRAIASAMGAAPCPVGGLSGSNNYTRTICYESKACSG